MSKEIEQSVQDWWRWFASHEQRIAALENPDELFWDEVLAQLKRVHGSLWFELSGTDEDGRRDFVFTAEGDTEAFPFADLLVAAAPETATWTFTALKPPMGFEFGICYEGLDFDPRQMWFLPLQDASDPASIGIRVGVPNYHPGQERPTQNAVLVILDTAIGERSSAQDIEHFEVGLLPANPEAAGYIELSDLPDYIAFIRRKHGATSNSYN